MIRECIAMKTVLAIIISYLFGSVPWGLVIGKVFYHKDIRNEGSGNTGATNAGRVLGRPVAVIVTVLDAVKALLSMLVANAIAPQATILAGLACCAGHCFPVFAQFRGGKAVATTYGFFLSIALLITHSWFWNFLFPVIVFFAVLYMTKMVSVSSMTSVSAEALVTLVQFLFHKVPFAVPASTILLAVFIIYRHRSNIERIKNGTESKIKWMG